MALEEYIETECEDVIRGFIEEAAKEDEVKDRISEENYKKYLKETTVKKIPDAVMERIIEILNEKIQIKNE